MFGSARYAVANKSPASSGDAGQEPRVCGTSIAREPDGAKPADSRQLTHLWRRSEPRAFASTSLVQFLQALQAFPTALEPSEGEQGERYDERTDRVLDVDLSGVRLEPRDKRGKATRWNEPVHGGDGKEQDAKKSGDQRQGSVHRADVREDRKFSVTPPP